MKKAFCLIALLAAAVAGAQDFTYSTNLFWALPFTTNIFCGTNGTDPGRDSYIVIWNKINHNTALLSSQVAGGGGGGGLAVTVSNMNASVVHVSNIKPGFTTNFLSGAAGFTVIPGLVLSNGFAGWSGDQVGDGGYYQLLFSPNAGAPGSNWFAFTTNVPVYAAINPLFAAMNTTGPKGLSNVVIQTWTAPQYFQDTNYILSQHLFADKPKYSQDVVTRGWFLTKEGQVTPGAWAGYSAASDVHLVGQALNLDARYQFSEDRSSTNYAALVLSEGGVPVMTFTTSNTWAHIDVSWDGSTMSLSIPASGLAGAPVIQRSPSAVVPVWSQIASTITLSGGNYTLTVPTGGDGAFFRAMGVTGYQVAVKGTIHADSFWGSGVGLTNLNHVVTNAAPGSMVIRSWEAVTNQVGGTLWRPLYGP